MRFFHLIMMGILMGGMNLAGCASKETSDIVLSNNLNQQERHISDWLDAYPRDTAFTLLLQSKSGNSYRHSVGNSSAYTSYESASTSKMVTATVVLALVEDGVLALDDHPQDYIADWPKTGKLSEITLQQLLNFTSGLTQSPNCLYFGVSDFSACIRTIATDNTSAEPGSNYYYAPTHLQVAGLMAVNAAIKGGRLPVNSDWNALFSAFKDRYGVFAQSTYDLPSARNPRLAGGMHWTAEDMLAFLQALAQGEILSMQSLQAMRTAVMADAVIESSPAADLGLSWRYGYGVWLEDCHSIDTICVSSRFSSLGAYGAYPFIDMNKGYWGLLARQGKANSFAKGYELMNSARPMLDNWAQLAAQ